MWRRKDFVAKINGKGKKYSNARGNVSIIYQCIFEIKNEEHRE